MLLTIFIIICTAVLSLIVTPIAIRLGIMDNPDFRKIHNRPIPKAGGIGIFIPVVVFEMAALISYEIFRTQVVQIMFVTIFLMITGIIDDRFDLSSKLKLAIHSLASLITVLMGIRFNISGLPIPDIIVTVIWISAIINAVNLIDGLDGLAAGITTISCAGFCTIGLIYNSSIIVFLSAAIVGSCLGFLKYNFRPAKIFMGDTGSIPLGYNLAVIGILCQNLIVNVTSSTKPMTVISGSTVLIIPAIILGVPIYDMTLSIFRRVVNRKPIFKPDRSHFYNLMMELKGLSHKKTVLAIYLVSFFLSCISILLVFLNSVLRVAVICVLTIAAAFLSYLLNFIRVD